MERPHVFVTRKILPEGLRKLEPFCQLDIWPRDLPPSREEMLGHSRGVEGLLCLLSDRVDAELIDSAGGQLKVISNFAAGTDNIDITAATARAIPVGNTPGVLTAATADFAFSLLLAAARRLGEADRSVRGGKWKTWGPSTLLGLDLEGATLGIIGFGRIGQAVARRAGGFGMRVLYHDPQLAINEQPVPGQKVNLETVLREADFVSLHIPLTPETHHLINSATLAWMKPTAVLVNTARGGVVDHQALYEALKSGSIFAAALDVTDPEPLPMDSPLLGLENLILTPHIASASRTARTSMSILAAENILAGLKGDPLTHCVNPEVYRQK